jgi:hypothetical protein
MSASLQSENGDTCSMSSPLRTNAGRHALEPDSKK